MNNVILVCPVCKSTDFTTIKYPRKKPYLDFEEIALCSNCSLGHVISKVTETELKNIYESGTYWGENKLTPNLSLHYKVQSEIRVSSVLKHLKKRSMVAVLDIGAGHPFIFDALAKELGHDNFQYSFLEPDDVASTSILRGKNTERVYEVPSGNKYDIIFLSHVLEHVLDPLNFLTQFRDALTSEGIIYIEVPHSDYRFKSDVFPHTLFFTEKALEKTITSSNLKLVTLNSFGRTTVEKRTKLKEKIFNSVLSKVSVKALDLGMENIAIMFLKLKFGYQKKVNEGLWIKAIARSEH